MGNCQCYEEKSVKTESDNKNPIIVNEPHNNNAENDNILTINKKRPLGRSKTNAEDFDLDNYIDSILNLHNELRKNYKLPLISKNEELNDMASKYAESLVNNQGKYNNISNIYKGQLVGENIIISDSKRAEDNFDIMTKEKNKYNYDENKFSKMTGHFTQIIWKETTDVGVGFWEDKINKKNYSVILYYPAGNCLGQFKKNINKEKK